MFGVMGLLLKEVIWLNTISGRKNKKVRECLLTSGDYDIDVEYTKRSLPYLIHSLQCCLNK